MDLNYPILLAALGLALISIGVSYLGHQSHKRKQLALKAFTDAHGFSYDQTSNVVLGTYQGYSFKLDTYYETRQSHTYITVTQAKNVTEWPSADHTLPQEAEIISQRVEALVSAAKPFAESITVPEFHSQKQCIYYRVPGLYPDIDNFLNLVHRLGKLLEAYTGLVTLEGVAVSAIGTSTIAPNTLRINNLNLFYRNLIATLIKDIGQITTKKFSNRASRTWCSRCLTRFSKHTYQSNWLTSIEYYGCRTCRQSRAYFDGQVVAILDNTEQEELTDHGRILHVNWLVNRLLFDFDEVHILNATDEEVERFAVQVGNDTDEVRQPGYAKMRCVVAPECELSLNTMRILERTFGQVSIG